MFIVTNRMSYVVCDDFDSALVAMETIQGDWPTVLLFEEVAGAWYEINFKRVAGDQ